MVCGEALRSRSRWRRKAAISACTSASRQRGEGRGRALAGAEPPLEGLEAGQGALRDGEPLAALVPDPLRKLRQQSEGDVGRLVVPRIAARDVAAEGAQRGVLGEGSGLLAAGAEGRG